MVYAGQRAEKSQRGMHLSAAGERRSSGSQSAARGAAAQRMGAPRARMRPLAAGVWRVVRSLLSPDFSLSHVGFRPFPAVYNTCSKAATTTIPNVCAVTMNVGPGGVNTTAVWQAWQRGHVAIKTM